MIALEIAARISTGLAHMISCVCQFSTRSYKLHTRDCNERHDMLYLSLTTLYFSLIDSASLCRLTGHIHAKADADKKQQVSTKSKRENESPNPEY